jgi:hypothetical protein
MSILLFLSEQHNFPFLRHQNFPFPRCQNFPFPRQQNGIPFPLHSKRNSVSTPLEAKFYYTQNGILFPLHSKRNSVSGLHYSINPNMHTSADHLITTKCRSHQWDVRHKSSRRPTSKGHGCTIQLTGGISSPPQNIIAHTHVMSRPPKANAIRTQSISNTKT